VLVAIYRKSHILFTGLVPAYLAEKISVLNGVLASSPEATKQGNRIIKTIVS